MNRDLILLEIAKNSEAMSALPQIVQEQILDFKNKNEEKILRKEAEESVRRRILLCKGEWGEKVPLERRFVLCEKDSKRYDPEYNSWEPTKEYRAIDLVRGYKSPFWYYFGDELSVEEFVKQRIKSVIEAKTEADLVRFLRREYSSFKVHYWEKDEKFCVCTYSLSPCFTITGRGEYKTLAEHQADLKREFCKNKKDD